MRSKPNLGRCCEIHGWSLRQEQGESNPVVGEENQKDVGMTEWSHGYASEWQEKRARRNNRGCVPAVRLCVHLSILVMEMERDRWWRESRRISKGLCRAIVCRFESSCVVQDRERHLCRESSSRCRGVAAVASVIELRINS